VPKPVEMYQLDAVPGRTFAALRIDKECCIDNDNEDMESCQSTFEEEHAALDMTATFISNLLSPYNPRQRAEVLQSLCARWQLRVGARGNMPYDEYCRQMVNRLSVRLSRVFGRRSSVSVVGGTFVSEPTDA
ncbi:putative receptor-type adenylate cyclase, partial [Trypanosoma theileri]